MGEVGRSPRGEGRRTEDGTGEEEGSCNSLTQDPGKTPRREVPWRTPSHQPESSWTTTSMVAPTSKLRNTMPSMCPKSRAAGSKEATAMAREMISTSSKLSSTSASRSMPPAMASISSSGCRAFEKEEPDSGSGLEERPEASPSLLSEPADEVPLRSLLKNLLDLDAINQKRKPNWKRDDRDFPSNNQKWSPGC